MAPTHDYDIANQTAPNFRADLNNALQAIVSNNSGSTEPPVTYANMLWYDTANDLLRMRNEANEAFITLGTLDQVANTFAATVALASQAEALAGTNNTKLMTPLRVTQSIAALAGGFTQDVQEFTSSGTWTAPANAKLVFVEISGGGGGGGSGARRAISGFSAGGGGGGGAAGNVNMFRASELTATVFVTIAAGGSGGALVTTNDTFGINGSAGGDSTFGSLLIGKGGLGGARGTNFSFGGSGSGLGGAQTTSVSATLSFSGSNTDFPSSLNAGAAGGRGGRAGSDDSLKSSGGGNVLLGGSGCAGGGGGGGLFTGPDVSNGGIGGERNSTVLTPPFATGATAGVAGAAGSGFGNAGGGGGAGVSTAAAAGGAGATGAGGGGGGGSANGFNSGAGGAGGNGFCRVTTYL